jgi:hypothetical protein
MTADWRRSVRLLFKFGLLVSLPLAGYLWAQTGMSPLAIGMSAVCVIMALGAEGLASGAEARLARLRTTADTEGRSFSGELASRDEQIRQMDRIVETLSNQNHDLRGKLVTIHGEVHRLNEETAHLVPDAEVSAVEESSGEPSADITDISSLRTRR